MNLPSFLAGILVGVMALWIFLELIALAAKRRAPAVTMARRKRRPHNPHIGSSFDEFLAKEGMLEGATEVAERRVAGHGIDYKLMGVTGSEE